MVDTTGGAVISFLEEYSDYFQQSNIWSMALRWIGWKLIDILSFLSNAAETIYRSCFELFGLFNNVKIRNLITSLEDYYWILLAISLLVIGINLIFAHEHKANLLQNIIIAIVIICIFPSLLIRVSQVTNAAVSSILDNSTINTSTTNDMIISNIYDLQASFAKHPNSFILEKPANIQMVSPDARLYNDQDWVNNAYIYDRITYYLEYDANGNAYLEETKYDGTFWQITQDTYYRYDIDYLTIIITLITLIIVFAVSAFKTVKLIYEIIVQWFLATFFSLSDLNGGQKIKQILQGTLYAFLAIYLISFCIVLYLTIVNALSSQTWGVYDYSFGNNAFLKAVIMIFLSVAVIDGPNIIERLIGVDAGLHSGMRTLMGLGASAIGAYHIGKNTVKTGASIVKGAAKFAKNTADLGTKGISSVAGWASAHKDAKYNSSNSSSNNNTLNTSQPNTTTNNNNNSKNNNQSNTNSINNQQTNNKSDGINKEIDSSQNPVNNKTEDNKPNVNTKTTDTSNIQPQNESVANESQNTQSKNNNLTNENSNQQSQSSNQSELTQNSEVTSDFKQPNDINNSVSSNIQPEQQQKNLEQSKLNNDKILDDSVNESNYPIYSDYMNDNLIDFAKSEKQKSQEKHLLFNSFRQNYHRQKADTMNKIHSKQNKKFEKATKEYNKNQAGGDKK